MLSGADYLERFGSDLSYLEKREILKYKHIYYSGSEKSKELRRKKNILS